jgi:CRP-like cAMP-binding protein
MESFKELRMLPLFSGIPEETLSSIATMLKEERFPAGHLVIKEGDPADFFYILRSGEMEVRKTIHRDSGKHKTLAILEEGDVFGEMAIFGEEVRAADVVTVKDSLLWRVDFKDFSHLLNNDPKIGLHLLKAMIVVLISRLKATNQELATLYEVGRIISSTRSMEELTGLVFEQVMRDVEPAKSGFVAVWNRYNEEFEIHHSLNLPKEHHLPINDPLILEMLERMSPLMVREISERPKLNERFYAGRSMLVSPMLYNNELTGLIALIHPSKKKAFTYSQMVLLSDVCTHLASALNNLEREQEDLLKERLSQKKVSY